MHYDPGKNKVNTSNSLAITNPSLAAEWDYDKNGSLLPDDISSKSGKKVWWIDSFGHSWEATIAHRNNGTGCPYCNNQKVLIGYNDLASRCPSFLSEWDYCKNTNIKPTEVTESSGKRVWWKCEKGHEWYASIHSRSSGTSCPFCAGNKVWPGFNDLATINPQLALFWDKDKNDGLTPENVFPNSHMIVWWKCDKEHEWKASVVSQNTKGPQCPYCSNKIVLTGYNDLKTKYPEIAKEWDDDKNGQLSASDVLPETCKKAWWKCERGHNWEAAISKRVTGSGCPYCAGRYAVKGETDLFSTNPLLAKEWNYEKNKPLTPSDVKQGSSKRVWWKCSKGHEWTATVNSRSYHKLGCPYCSNKRIIVGFNDLGTTDPDLAEQWNYNRNGVITPSVVTCGSGKKVWWKCDKGHEWKSDIVSRHHGNGCPFCSNTGTSFPEQGIAYYLSQCCEIVQRVKIANCEIDVYIPTYKIGVEYDGEYYHQDKTRDEKKEKTLNSAGVSLIRVKESKTNTVLTNGTILYIADKMGSNYEWALCALLDCLSIKTNNPIFSRINVDVKRDRIEIRKRYDLIKKEESILSKYPELCKEWNETRNGLLKPEMFSFGSDQSVWWKCSNGHEWVASISNRAKGRGCPICKNKKIIPGINDLATINPELIKEWDYNKNVDILPSAIAPNARKKVWWICSKCGGSYQSWVYSRSNGTGCPYCCVPPKKALKGYNDLATQNPELLEEWDSSSNVGISPDEILPKSNKKVWWKCKNNHQWLASVAHRTSGQGCPFCSGRRVLVGFNDLKTIKPALVKEWDYAENYNLTPEMFTVGSNKKVWWCCSKGHKWQAVIYNRAKGSGCPFCSGNRKG